MKQTPYSRHKKPLNADMNVVPYIDVMLVLLVIFMVTAPMLTTGVAVDLPQEKTSSLQKDDNLPVIVSIKADGSLLMSYEGAIDEPVNETVLFERIHRLAQKNQNSEGKSNLQVIVNADAKNEYKNIMHIMAGLQQAGVVKVGLLTSAPKHTK